MKNIIFFLSLCGILAACEPLEDNSNKKQYGGSNNNSSNTNNSNGRAKNNNNSNNNGGNQAPSELSYKGKKLILTKHAKCRMGCRYIDESEIMEIIAKNNINQRKSTTTAENGKCPTTAYEGVSRDDQELRIIVAYCEGDDVVRVVTVIDTGNEFNCTCD